MDKTRDFRLIRAAARARSDFGLERAMTAELERLGYPDPEIPDRGAVAFETAVPETFEKAVPSKRGGRPKLPRCEHGQVASRCVDCNDETIP